ncbi:hypothetical protein [Helicobacter cappadocius]|uniref:Uncharacterized protein n=1 Tax=Helicobacter cappadocius TaxID=3063998 RepID=A0AA90PRN3_9HELI|nr:MULTISPECIES: hypothetical protein [unclassified Helicobacter]MDO7253895.1 hypothetical protein [Helicobacter sp. faydin-H75]MDP2539756.1 hypothetical protein [Helicobacter sp. faydin-H76]
MRAYLKTETTIYENARKIAVMVLLMAKNSFLKTKDITLKDIVNVGTNTAVMVLLMAKNRIRIKTTNT